jgi:DNA-binding response OmpR family regulator
VRDTVSTPEPCRQVKSQELTKQILVILFSAIGGVTVCGADDFLPKPFRIGELLDLMARKLTPRPQNQN